uniref:PRA1 family protein n=1 Tax=Elaeophora elaphi TaxID=1147741 RepID=A0A0R3S6V3_9BILA
MSEDAGEDSRDVQCATNFRAFHDIRAWCRAVKPWNEFFRLSQFGSLASTDRYVARMKKNFTQFMANYIVISAILMICAIITSFWLLLSSILLGILVYFIYTKTRDGPIRIGTEEIPAWILYAAAIFITLPLFIYAGVGYILYCAMGISIIVVLIHASLYNSESLVLPEVKVKVVTKVDDQPRVAAAPVEIVPDQGMASRRHVLFHEIEDEDH